MMKAIVTALALLLARICVSQSAADAAVQLSVSTQVSPPEITLHWIAAASTNGYQVHRKLKTATTWGSPLASLSGTATQFTDITALPGMNYEYRVLRNGATYTGYGYVNAGILVPEIEFRGRIILLVDSTFALSLDPELDRLAEDMEGDGWEVIRKDVDRNGSVSYIKSLIVTEYNNDPVNTKAVFLFGHVPVPYSGNLNPDAHPDHLGAWPADVYYGDVNGTWTDNAVNSTTASPPRTQNVPGDGKFDQSAVSGLVELEVGRVDLSSMTSFSATGNEEQLLRNYLEKDHEYRKKIFVPVKRAVIDDNFGYFSGEAFASGGWRNFAPLVGSASVTAADYTTSLNSGSYQWSYGCGGGSFTSAGGIGNTAAFASSTLQGVFTMLFGSYFGDWDTPNNFLRAPLAKGRTLTNVWSGRPHYHFHHMGLGENIGYSLLQTQNYSGSLYFASPFGITGKWIHNALMGDPTLRNDVVAPVSDVLATRSGYHCLVTWSPSPDTSVIGYSIYMRNDTNRSYVRLNSVAISDTGYIDSCMMYPGIYSYMVRAVKLEQTPSGTYYNMSEGIADTALNTLDPNVHASFTVQPGSYTYTFINTSAGSAAFVWDGGNGDTSADTNFVTTYTTNGFFSVRLIAFNECDADTFTQVVQVTGVVVDGQAVSPAKVFPNPAVSSVTVISRLKGALHVRDVTGRLLVSKEKTSDECRIDLSNLAGGLYLVEICDREKREVVRISKQ